jgi:hypothetical protein
MKDDPYQLLRAASLSGKDEQDAAVMAARAAAAGQPEMLARLEAEHARDQELRAALSGVGPPPGLEASLLTAMRAARAVVDPPSNLEQNVIKAMQQAHRPAEPSRPRKMNRRTWIAWGSAAAAASIAAGTTWWWRTAAFSMARLRNELAGISQRGVELSLMSMDPQAVQDWLTSHQAPRPTVLPEALQALPRKGCHLYQIAGHPVSLECFLLPGMRELHLFCTPSQYLLDPPKEHRAPNLRQVKGLTMCCWSTGGQTVLLVGKESPETLSGLLRGLTG